MLDHDQNSFAQLRICATGVKCLVEALFGFLRPPLGGIFISVLRRKRLIRGFALLSATCISPNRRPTAPEIASQSLKAQLRF